MKHTSKIALEQHSTKTKLDLPLKPEFSPAEGQTDSQEDCKVSLCEDSGQTTSTIYIIKIHRGKKDVRFVTATQGSQPPEIPL